VHVVEEPAVACLPGRAPVVADRDAAELDAHEQPIAVDDDR